MVISNESAMEQFKQVCLEEYKLRLLFVGTGNNDEEADRVQKQMLDASEEQDWFSLSLGFFKALGLSCEDCHDLAIQARYTHHYWC
jgi:hypothetical protein